MPYIIPGLDIYNRKPTDQKLHNKNFFLRMELFIDKERITKDRDAYLKGLSLVSRELEGVNFRQNLLFYCSEDIHNEVFFKAYMSLGEYLSVHSCNMMNVTDIWWDNDREEFQSEQQLSHQVLCLFSDIEMWLNAANGQVINTVLSSRASGNRYDGKPQYTWIFLRGTETQFKLDKLPSGSESGYPYIVQLFSNNSINGFETIDLNLRTKFISNVQKYRQAWLAKRLQIQKLEHPELIIPKTGPRISTSRAVDDEY